MPCKAIVFLNLIVSEIVSSTTPVLADIDMPARLSSRVILQ